MELLASRADGIEVEAGESKIGNIADLYSASRRDRAALLIKAKSPKITVHLFAGDARIEIADASSAGIALAEEVRAHLEYRRQKTPVGVVARILYSLLATFAVSLALFVSSVWTSPRAAVIVTGCLALLMLFALLSLGSALLSSGAVKLELGERPGDVQKVRLHDVGELPEHVTAFRLGFVRLYLDDLVWRG
jgi:hypothetical protein